jgi:hypothetical protein
MLVFVFIYVCHLNLSYHFICHLSSSSCFHYSIFLFIFIFSSCVCLKLHMYTCTLSYRRIHYIFSLHYHLIFIFHIYLDVGRTFLVPHFTLFKFFTSLNSASVSDVISGDSDLDSLTVSICAWTVCTRLCREL